jgi:dihydropteroate synthase
MQEDPHYPRGVVEEITVFLEERVEAVTKLGVSREQIILDPGIGFGKTVEHNLTILRDLERFTGLELPLMVGASRKWFIGEVTGRPVDDRIQGSVAAAVSAVLNGAAIVRTHDIEETLLAVQMASAIRMGTWP